MHSYIFLIGVAVIFAMNMGASGIAPSFAAVYGGNLIKKHIALLLFTVFVVLGAVTLGKNVSLTLGKNLLPKEFLSLDTALIILAASTLSLFISNILNIPQSTSQVTVGSITGAGLYFRHLYLKTLFLKIIPMWIILPAGAYLLTFFLYRIIYPPKHNNLHIYEKIFAHTDKLKIYSIFVSCYVAFAIGANNVANAVGPLFGAGILGITVGLVGLSGFFGLGAWLMGSGPLHTAGKDIVPLGIFSSTLVSFVTGTLLIFASALGIPQSLVQLNIFSIFAISSLKNGHRNTLDRYVTKKTFIVWIIAPVFSMLLAYTLLFLRHNYLR